MTARESRRALEAKEGILAYLAQYMPRDWPERVRIRTIGHPQAGRAEGECKSESGGSPGCPPAAATSSTHSINGGPPPIKGTLPPAGREGDRWGLGR